mmetsp:Transcript_8857/g.26187  ORF Transcript_8857/g.26187 Transcript_8857/m.26187 type:complete len:240 (-) Transcript_8857:4608-5327(-)
MKATQTLKRSLASAKPTCLTARSATCRARSRSLIFRWNAMYLIQTMEVSPWVRSMRSKSSTLFGSVALRPSAFSASRSCSSLLAAAFWAFFWRLEGRLLPSSSSSSSSFSSPSSESLSAATLKSANSKPVSLCFSEAAAKSQGAASSSESGALALTLGLALVLASNAAVTFSTCVFAFFFGRSSAGSASSAPSASSASWFSRSSSSSSSLSSSPSSSSSKSDGLMPSHTLLFSNFSTFA